MHNRPQSRLVRLAALSLVTVFALASCGGDDDDNRDSSYGGSEPAESSSEVLPLDYDDRCGEESPEDLDDLAVGCMGVSGGEVRYEYAPPGTTFSSEYGDAKLALHYVGMELAPGVNVFTDIEFRLEDYDRDKLSIEELSRNYSVYVGGAGVNNTFNTCLAEPRTGNLAVGESVTIRFCAEAPPELPDPVFASLQDGFAGKAHLDPSEVSGGAGSSPETSEGGEVPDEMPAAPDSDGQSGPYEGDESAGE